MTNASFGFSFNQENNSVSNINKLHFIDKKKRENVYSKKYRELK